MTTNLDVKFDIRAKSGKAVGIVGDGTDESGRHYILKSDVYGMELLAPRDMNGIDGKLTLLLGEKTFYEIYLADLQAGANEIPMENVINKGWSIAMHLDYTAEKLGQCTLSLRLRNE